MIRKSFKTVGTTLTLNGSEDQMFIDYNPLLEDAQVIGEQVEQPTDEQDEEWKMQKFMIITICRRKRMKKRKRK